MAAILCGIQGPGGGIPDIRMILAVMLQVLSLTMNSEGEWSLSFVRWSVEVPQSIDRQAERKKKKEREREREREKERKKEGKEEGDFLQ